MSVLTYARYLRSAEGPFSKVPKSLRVSIVKFAYLLAIPIYAFPAKKAAVNLALMGKYLALHEQELLFFMAKINYEVNLQNEPGHPDSTLVGHVIARMFGEIGSEAILSAFDKINSDGVESRRTLSRVWALVEASRGINAKMTGLVEYSEGIVAGNKFGYIAVAGNLSSEYQAAYFGLHYLYFSRIFDTAEFSNWLLVQLEGRYAAQDMHAMFEKLWR